MINIQQILEKEGNEAQATSFIHRPVWKLRVIARAMGNQQVWSELYEYYGSFMVSSIS